MSAEQLGRRLLDEVEEESLDDLLSEIRALEPPSQTSKLGILTLDQIIDVFRRPQQPMRRPAWSSPTASSEDDAHYYDNIGTPARSTRSASSHSSRPKANVIQLTSARSSAGKSSLLYYLSARAILPREYVGNESAIVWLDADGRFSALRLAQIASQMLNAGIGKAECDAIVRDALTHVHVFRPQSSVQLIKTLQDMPGYLLSQTQHHSRHRSLSLLVLDSATAFYWTDRGDAEVARLSHPAAAPSSSATSRVIAEMKELEGIFGCAVCFTTDASLQRKPKSGPVNEARTVADSTLPPQNDRVFQDPWTSFATLTVDVQRLPVPQFAPAMTIEECTRDQPRRMEAVKRGRHRAEISWTGNESSEVNEGIKSLQNGEGFFFRVTSEGIIME